MLEIGGSLRHARRRARLEVLDVEAETMIPARYLDAIEGERFELLPAGPYRRSFLREYAEYLGLRGDLYVEEYVVRFEPPEPKPEPEPARASAARHLSRALEEVTAGRAAVGVGLVAAAVGVWLLGTGAGSGGKPPLTTAAIATPPAAHHHHVARAPAKPKAAFAPPAARPPALELAATRGDCWLELRVGSSTGPVVYEHVLRQGETARFGLRKALWLRVGAPWNLEAKIGRHSVTSDLPPRTGNAEATASGLSAR